MCAPIILTKNRQTEVVFTANKIEASSIFIDISEAKLVNNGYFIGIGGSDDAIERSVDHIAGHAKEKRNGKRSKREPLVRGI